MCCNLKISDLTTINNNYFYIKHRWYYEIYCKKSNIIIGRSHKRSRVFIKSDIAKEFRHVDHDVAGGYDFFSPVACGCGSCSVLSDLITDSGVTLHRVAAVLGVFKGGEK